MSSELTLLLVRHGETAWNAERRWQGQRDTPLSDAGRAQAARLRDRLRREWSEGVPSLPGPPTHIFTSTLSRARETAEIVAQALPLPVPLIETPLLRERGFGDWEGLTREEVLERFGPDATRDTHETWESVAERMNDALTLVRSHTESGIVLVVGHGGSLRYFLTCALSAPPETAHNFRLDNVSLSIVALFGEVRKDAIGHIQLVNDTAHLQGAFRK